MLGYLRSLLFSSNDNENVLGGADEVFSAILEHSDEATRYLVEMGEPELVDRGGEFQQDFMVRVPTETGPGEPEPPNIEYDLPEGEDADSDLYQLLDLYGIDTVSEIGQLAGETVSATFENGTLTLRFDLLEQEMQDTSE